MSRKRKQQSIRLSEPILSEVFLNTCQHYKLTKDKVISLILTHNLDHSAYQAVNTEIKMTFHTFSFIRELNPANHTKEQAFWFLVEDFYNKFISSENKLKRDEKARQLCFYLNTDTYQELTNTLTKQFKCLKHKQSKIIQFTDKRNANLIFSKRIKEVLWNQYLHKKRDLWHK